MGAKLKIDWELGRALYLQGLCLSEISAKLGCNGSTLRSVAMRQRWKQVAEQSREIVQQATLKERGESWQERMASLAERHLAALEAKDPGRLTLRDFESLAAILDKTNKTGRLTFGLGDDSGKTMIGLRQTITILNPPNVSPRADAANEVSILDAEAV